MNPAVLIVKTSSLGDIVQSFPVLHFLHQLLPSVAIDWVVEKKFSSIVAAHPLVRKTISVDRDHLLVSFCELRKTSYEFVFDLQGNSKSALITFFSKGQIKVGFDWSSLRERLNVLGTHFRFNVSQSINIRLQYLSLISQFFQVPVPSKVDSVLFKMDSLESKMLEDLYRNKLKNRDCGRKDPENFPSERISIAKAQSEKIEIHLMEPKVSQRACKIMVCPGSQWINKQVSLEVMTSFLLKIQKKYNAVFLLMWGNPKERIFCEEIQKVLPQESEIMEKLPLTVWQNLMNRMDLVIAVDSSALHLCGTTTTASFSVFGPTSPNIFKPIGEQHFSFQGSCPFGKIFEKRCPILRTCSTGACIKNLSSEELFQSFSFWWDRREPASLVRKQES